MKSKNLQNGERTEPLDKKVSYYSHKQESSKEHVCLLEEVKRNCGLTYRLQVTQKIHTCTCYQHEQWIGDDHK